MLESKARNDASVDVPQKGVRAAKGEAKQAAKQLEAAQAADPVADGHALGRGGVGDGHALGVCGPDRPGNAPPPLSPGTVYVNCNG